MGLNNRQRVFIEEYLRCWNASEAARRAGYKGRANVRGAQLLANVSISAAIKARLTELQMSADEVLIRFADQARGSMESFIDPDLGRIDLTKAEQAGKLHLIKSFRRSTGKTETVAIELYDAQNALVQIGRTLGMFVDKIAPVDPSGKHEYQPVSAEERERAAQELAEWRKKQLDALNGLSATLTQDISSTPTA